MVGMVVVLSVMFVFSLVVMMVLMGEIVGVCVCYVY